jgi:hypothetical protein
VLLHCGKRGLRGADVLWRRKSFMGKVFWFFFSKKNRPSFLKKRSKKLLLFGDVAWVWGIWA